jgi:signal peptidase I
MSIKAIYRNNKCYIHILALSIAFIFMVTQLTKLELITSNSIGKKLVLTLKYTTPKKGDYVSIEGQETKYLGKINCVKILTGVAGDSVRIKDGIIYINSLQIGRLLNKTKDGNPLTAQSTLIIPKGYIFVTGIHDRSYDSRYEEFGLVKTGKIVGKSIGLL